jgi:pyridoxal phosphate enzyme (YggS family)
VILPDGTDESPLGHNIDEIRERVHLAAIEADRDPAQITITAVSKTFPREMVDEAYRLGLTTFGENRVQEAKAKFEGDLPTDMRVHLIGQLQTNKARQAIAIFDRIESVDRLSLVQALEKEAAKADTLVSVLLQVNIGREPQKAGCMPEDAATLVAAIRESGHLRLDGLMGIAPLVEYQQDARPYFRSLRELRDELAMTHPDLGLGVLSMGMSGDFEAAIAEGATHVRVGSAIFGSR